MASDNIATHLRITGLNVTNEDVDTRRKAINDLATTWRAAKDVNKILSKVALCAEALSGDGTPPAALAQEVQAAIQEHASAFLAEESPLEIGICAGSALVQILEVEPNGSGYSTIDVFGVAVECALSYHVPVSQTKREALRLEVLNSARTYNRSSALKSRERKAVPDIAEVLFTTDAEGKISSNIAKAFINTVETLRRNAIIDREELDFLWWAQCQRSTLLDKSWSELDDTQRAISAAMEGALSLRRLPSRSHFDLVLRSERPADELDHQEVLEKIESSRAALSTAVPSIAIAHPLVFPLLVSIAKTDALLAPVALKRTIADWSARAHLEMSLATLIANGLPKV